MNKNRFFVWKMYAFLLFVQKIHWNSYDPPHSHENAVFNYDQ